VAKLAVLLNPRFFASLKRLGEADVTRVESVLHVLPDCSGQPHLHTGISIRWLKNNIFECRAGLKIRILFRANAQTLDVFFISSHDEVRSLVRHL
jgi:mRNA-degrading endonuclease RelE of RelBE toxin-antitoxin system